MEFAGGFISTRGISIRGKGKSSERDLSRLSIIGDIPIRSSPKHSCLLTVTTFLPEKGPEKVGSFCSKTLTLITETGQK